MSGSKQPDEQTALVRQQNQDDVVAHIRNAYGGGDHCKFSPHYDNKDREVILDYDPLKFSSFRVFTFTKGTVLRDPVLMIEQLLITAIFIGFAVPVYVYFNQDHAENRHGDGQSVRKWIAKQDPLMRQFAMIMTGLAAFLLTFYTGMCVGRWWMIRTAGIGGIKAATVELEMFICQLVTKDETVLDAIRRYGRTSMMLLFMWRGHQIDDKEEMKSKLVDRGFLTQEEVGKIVDWSTKHEVIWAWQAGIVTMLYKEGKIKSDNLFRLLMDRVANGRKAVQTVHTHLAVRIPMQYVHMLGLLVKMHNAVLAIIMGILFGAAIRNGETIICIQTFCRTLILPFLFNAILLINAELADPFNGSATDFPGGAYVNGLDADCKKMVEATQNFPDWLANRTDRSALRSSSPQQSSVFPAFFSRTPQPQGP